MDIKLLANVIASTLAGTSAEIPEGHLYAAVMSRANLDEFQMAIDVLIKTKLVERRSGPTIASTAKLRAFAPQFEQVAKGAA